MNDLARYLRRIQWNDPPQFIRRGARRINAERRGASRLVTGFNYQVARRFVPGAEWIRKMLDGLSKSVLKRFLAAKNFLAQFLGFQVPKISVRH